VEAPDLVAGKKNAARLGAHIVFSDESGFLLIPTVRKTWAPRGLTPRLRHRYRRDRISVISAVSLSPRRRRLGLYYRLHETNINQVLVCDFVRHLLRHLRGPIILIWDNGRIHKGDPIRSLCRRFPRLRLEAFPSYAPELNPDEGVWSLAKRSLANGRPDDVPELKAHLASTLGSIARSQRKLRWCLTQSALPLLLP
jgi:transposase